MQPSRNIAARAGRWSAQHRKSAILGWLGFVIVSLVIGMSLVPQKEIDSTSGLPGETGQAQKALDGAFPEESAEQVLIQSKQLDAADPRFQAAVADMTQRLRNTGGVANVGQAQVSADGHSALVTFDLPGDSDTAEKSVVGSLAAVAAAQKAHPHLRVEEMGDASMNKEIAETSGAEMGKSMLLSLPLTLIILVFAFGALLAAGIPVLLALTSVAATMGCWAPSASSLRSMHRSSTSCCWSAWPSGSTTASSTSSGHAKSAPQDARTMPPSRLLRRHRDVRCSSPASP